MIIVNNDKVNKMIKILAKFKNIKKLFKNRESIKA